MRCISSLETTGEAHFFLNGTNLEERDDVNVVRSEESIVFLLRQDLEGATLVRDALTTATLKASQFSLWVSCCFYSKRDVCLEYKFN